MQYSLERRSAYKSNAFIQFDEVIYLDRYCDSRFDELAESRAQVAAWRTELETCADAVKQLTLNTAYPMPVPDMLDATARILEECGSDQENRQEYEQALEFLQQEATAVRNTIESKSVTPPSLLTFFVTRLVNTHQIAELRLNIKRQYAHLREHAYKLHAVFVHQGKNKADLLMRLTPFIDRSSKLWPLLDIHL